MSDTLIRFKSAQASPHAGFEAALREIRAGAKRGHWIWYVFPQISGLGTSETSRFFALDGEEEAVTFLRDPELRSRLLTITKAVAQQLRTGQAGSLGDLMGSDTDARKVVSSLTLFRHVASSLHAIEDTDEYQSLAMAAAEVLAAAAAEGYPACAHTLRRLGRPA